MEVVFRNQVRACGLCDCTSYVCVHRLMLKTYPQVSRLEILVLLDVGLRRLPSFENPFSDGTTGARAENTPLSHASCNVEFEAVFG